MDQEVLNLTYPFQKQSQANVVLVRIYKVCIVHLHLLLTTFQKNQDIT